MMCFEEYLFVPYFLMRLKKCRKNSTAAAKNIRLFEPITRLKLKVAVSFGVLSSPRIQLGKVPQQRHLHCYVSITLISPHCYLITFTFTDVDDVLPAVSLAIALIV